MAAVVAYAQPAQAADWAQISGGSNFTLAVKSDGTLWAWGNNTFGQLGDGTTIPLTKPVQIGTDSDWAFIAAGGLFSLATKTNGSMWAWGRNNKGQLGDGTITDRLSPVQVRDPSGIGFFSGFRSFAAGDQHALAVRSDGALFSWGDNNSGQLGLGMVDSFSHTRPIQVGTAVDWTAVRAGALHSLAQKTAGYLWAWGRNKEGQVGCGPVGTNCDGIAQSTPVGVRGSIPDWISFSGGSFHSVGATVGGAVYTWGGNSSGQLGTGNTTPSDVPVKIPVVARTVQAGSAHNLALSKSGALYAWGLNNSGQLGIGSFVNALAPTQVGAADWVRTGVGSGHSLAIKANLSLWSWGSNSSGQLGIGATGNSATPVPVDGIVTLLSTLPPSADGNNGWFRTTPTVSLSRNVEPGTTSYQWDSSTGTWEVYSAPFKAQVAQHVLYYRSADSGGTLEDTKNAALNVDPYRPDEPTLTGTAASPTQVNLFWSGASDGTSGLAGYRVYNPDNGIQLAATSATTHSFAVAAGSTVRYYVRAEDLAGNLSGPSNTVVVSTSGIGDTTPPSRPSLAAFVDSPGQIDIRWTPSSDNVKVAGYKLYSSEIPIATTVQTGYSDTGLPAGYHTYYVIAFDAAGNTSLRSNEVRIRLEAGGTTSGDTPAEDGEFAVTVMPPGGPGSVTFKDVTESGTTTATKQASANPAPPGYKLRGDQWDIHTTAKFRPPVNVALKYDERTVKGPENALRLFHFEGGRWVDVTVFVDTTNNILYGAVSSFSLFSPGEPELSATGEDRLGRLALGLTLLGIGFTAAVRLRRRTPVAGIR